MHNNADTSHDVMHQYQHPQRVQGWCKPLLLAWLLCICADPDIHAVIAVDLTQGQAPLPDVEPPVPGNHDLAATLKALAANSTSFGGNSAAQGAGIDPDGIDPEMIARSERHCTFQWHCCQFCIVPASCVMSDENCGNLLCCVH